MLARFWRTTFGLVAIVALALAAVTLGIGRIAYEMTHEALEEQLDHRIATETTALLAETRQDGLAGLAKAIRRRETARSTASLDYLLVDGNGRRLAGEIVADPPARPGYEEHFHYHRDGKTSVAQALTTHIGGGVLVVAADRAELYDIDRAMMALFAGALATMLGGGIAAAALIGWLTRRRLARIDATAHAIIEGELARRVPRDGSGSEFDRLAGTLNRMLDRIGGLMENLRQVSSDVAHDLRTPLTRLYNSLDRGLADPDPARQARQIETARAQAAELLEIFAALLRIAEIEGMAERLPRQPLDLSSLVEQMAENYRPDMEESGHPLRCVVEPGITVSGDRRLLSQAIANLLDNALRHTPAGTCVRVSAQRADGHAQVVISDDGPGIDPADAGRLFQRFARSERARSTPGHGLGLALVAAVASAHGGRVALGEGHGFQVVICLPEDP